VSAILADFERHREQVLTHLRHDHAAAYARLVARFLPPGTLGGLEEAPAAPPALAGLPREALDDALATLGTALDDIDWSALGRAEDLLLRETARARLVAEVAAAMGRNNGENTVAEAADEGAAADLAGAER
jgi:hypothetical protein